MRYREGWKEVLWTGKVCDCVWEREGAGGWLAKSEPGLPSTTSLPTPAHVGGAWCLPGWGESTVGDARGGLGEASEMASAVSSESVPVMRTHR